MGVFFATFIFFTITIKRHAINFGVPFSLVFKPSLFSCDCNRVKVNSKSMKVPCNRMKVITIVVFYYSLWYNKLNVNMPF